MAQRVLYPDHIEPLVQFVEETTPERIVAATHDKLTAGTPVKDMLLASALAVVRSSDLPPGHHGGPLHPLAGLHAVRHISARLPGEYAKLPVIQNVAVANKHIHSPAMGPFLLADAQPVSENDDVDATIKAFRTAVSRGVYNACDHYFLYLLGRRSPMQMLELLLEVGIAKNQLDDHYFLFPVFTWRALEYFGWEYAKYIGRAPVRYVTRPTAPATLARRRRADQKARAARARPARPDRRGRDRRHHRARGRDRALQRLERDSRDARAGSGRWHVARGGRREPLGRRLDAVPALADRQPDGRAHQHGRQYPAVSAAPA